MNFCMKKKTESNGHLSLQNISAVQKDVFEEDNARVVSDSVLMLHSQSNFFTKNLLIFMNVYIGRKFKQYIYFLC